jgi:hypothetical protein
MKAPTQPSVGCKSKSAENSRIFLAKTEIGRHFERCSFNPNRVSVITNRDSVVRNRVSVVLNEFPASETEIPSSETEIPSSETEIPSPQIEIRSSLTEIYLFRNGIPSLSGESADRILAL